MSIKPVIKWSIIVDVVLIAIKFLGMLLGKVLGFIISSPFRLIGLIIRTNGVKSMVKSAASLGIKIASPLAKVGGLLKYALIAEGAILAVFLLITLLKRFKKKSVQDNISHDVQEEYREQNAPESKSGRSDRYEMDEF